MPCKAQAVGYCLLPTRPQDHRTNTTLPLQRRKLRLSRGRESCPAALRPPCRVRSLPAGLPLHEVGPGPGHPPWLALRQRRMVSTEGQPLCGWRHAGTLLWGLLPSPCPSHPRRPVSIRACHRLQNGIWVPGPGARPQGLLTLRGTEAAHGGCPESTCRAVCRVQAPSTGSVYTGPPASLLGNEERGMRGLASQILRRTHENVCVEGSTGGRPIGGGCRDRRFLPYVIPPHRERRKVL